PRGPGAGRGAEGLSGAEAARARPFQGGGEAARPHSARGQGLPADAARRRPAQSDRPRVMTAPSDRPEATAPEDPAVYRPKPLLGATFWAMVAFAVLCVLAGVAIANFGPRLLADRYGSAATPAAPVAAEPATPSPAPASTAPAAALAPAADPAPDVARLDARVTRLETEQAHASQAAAAALAASVVVEASQGAAPFAEELAAFRAIAP